MELSSILNACLLMCTIKTMFGFQDDIEVKKLARRNLKNDGPGLEVRAGARRVPLKRPIKYLTGIGGNNPKLGAWSAESVCPIDTWIDTYSTTLPARKLHYTRNIALGCLQLSDRSEFPKRTIIYTPPTIRESFYHGCRSQGEAKGYPKKSLLIGLSFSTEMKEDKLDAIVRMNYLCAGKVKEWVGENQTGSKEFICEENHAICSLQSRIRNKKYISDLKIGCCPVTSKYWQVGLAGRAQEMFEEIFDFQNTGDLPFLFADKVPLKSRLFNRYNIFYASLELPGEVDFRSHRCPEGQYFTSFQVTNPESTYYNGNRIYKIVFTCSSPRIRTSPFIIDPYDQYTKINQKLIIGTFSNLKENRTCKDGYYDGVELIYHVKRERRFLVEAWSIKMRCSRDEEWDVVTHGYGFNGAPDIPDNSTPTGACVSCKNGWGLCGFDAVVTVQSHGTVEGLFFKFVCCPPLVEPSEETKVEL